LDQKVPYYPSIFEYNWFSTVQILEGILEYLHIKQKGGRKVMHQILISYWTKLSCYTCNRFYHWYNSNL